MEYKNLLVSLFTLSTFFNLLDNNAKEKKISKIKTTGSSNAAVSLYNQKKLLQEFPLSEAFFKLYAIIKSERFFIDMLKSLGFNINDIATIGVGLDCVIEEVEKEMQSTARISKIIITKNNNETVIIDDESKMQDMLNQIGSKNPNIMAELTMFFQKNTKLFQQAMQENQILAAIPQVIAQIMQTNKLNALSADILFNVKTANISIDLL